MGTAGEAPTGLYLMDMLQVDDEDQEYSMRIHSVVSDSNLVGISSDNLLLWRRLFLEPS